MNSNDYLRIANNCEEEGCFYIAKAAYEGIYMSADREEEKEYAINKIEHIDVLTKEKNYIEHMNEVKKYLVSLLEQKYYNTFADMIFLLLREENIEESIWIDTDIAILKIFAIVYKNEVKNSFKNTVFDKHSIDNINAHYYKLKYLIRRIEVDLNSSRQEDIIEYIIKEDVSQIEIVVIEDRININKDLFYYRFTELLLKDNMSDYAAFFMNYLSRKYRNVKDAIDNKVNIYDYMKVNKYSSQLMSSDKKVEFIICVNNENQFDECKLYLESLHSDGVEVNITPIYNAKCIATAYKAAMYNSDADYKVYMHQDVFVINPYFIYDFMKIFENDNNIGMMGVAGGKKIGRDGNWVSDDLSNNYINIYQDIVAISDYTGNSIGDKPYIEVEAIDGVMMITSRDIEWRDDIFDGWHYYDVSQSVEMRKSGYKVVIPRQEVVWCLHEQKYHKSIGIEYEEYQKRFIETYIDVKSKSLGG